jgi:hypothetical protein
MKTTTLATSATIPAAPAPSSSLATLRQRSWTANQQRNYERDNECEIQFFHRGFPASKES